MIAELTKRFGEARYEDMLDKMRHHGLIAHSERLGRGKGSAYSFADAQHIYRVFEIRSELGDNWNYSTLAFALAANGVGMKYWNSKNYVDLVAQYTEEGVVKFSESNEELVPDIGVGRTDAMRPKPPEVRVAQTSTSGWFDSLGFHRSDKTERMFKQSELLFEVFIGTWLYGKPISSYANTIRQAAYLMVTDPAYGDEWYAELHDFFQTLVPRLRRIRSENPMLSAIHRAKQHQPHIILQAANDAARFYASWWEALSDIPDVEFQFKRKDIRPLRRAIGSLGALMAGISVELQLENPKHPILAALRDGSLGPDLKKIVNSLYATSIAELSALTGENSNE